MSSRVAWKIEHPKQSVLACGGSVCYEEAWHAAMRALPIPPSHMNDDEYVVYNSTPVNPTVIDFRDYTVTMGPA